MRIQNKRYRRSNKKDNHMMSDKGSIVLDASLVMPIFLFFIVFLIYFVQMTLFVTALQTAASETAKKISAHMYPVSLAVDAAGAVDSGWNGMGLPGSGDGGIFPIPELSLTDMVAKYASALPEPIGEWASMAAASGEAPLLHLQSSASETVLDPVIKPLISPVIENTVLEYDRIHVNGIDLPNLKENTNPYFGVELTYELPLKVPFIGKSIRIQASSKERIWIGATDEGTSEGDGNSDSKGNVSLLSKPEPAYIARQATIRAKITPGASANLSVFYKTGESTAKHVGWATADENGYVEWTWFVGTRTTPGTWPFVIETSDGARLEVMFEVASKS
ncbi:TadE family protein [Paenibacillus sp. Marseille-Q4541]|uniref:TadE family protein n=1 Tax=Paenibacillus sp. Marseille-Q4541 TaxID=2831522 RepID=UPI0020194D4C|nr:TadE family protein [Paenibacillus sp. Marseille-Q4541]